MSSVEGVTFTRVVHSEWTKLLSLRSVWLTLGCSAAVTVGVSGWAAWGAHARGTATLSEAIQMTHAARSPRIIGQA